MFSNKWFNINRISTKIWLILIWAILLVVFFIFSNFLTRQHYNRVLTRTHNNGFVILDNIRSLQLAMVKIEPSEFNATRKTDFSQSSLNQSLQEMRRLWEETKQLSEPSSGFDEFDTLFTQFKQTTERVYINLGLEPQATTIQVPQRWVALKGKLNDQLDLMVESKRKTEYRYFNDQRDFQAAINKWSIVASLLAIGLFITLSVWTIYLITRPLGRVIDVIHELNKGNFKVRTNITGKDEISQLAQNLDEFAITLGTIFDEFIGNSKLLGESSEELSSSAVQIEKATDEIAKGTDQEADLLNTNKNVILEIANSVNSATQEIKDIQQIATEAVKQAEEVSASINQIDTSMTMIQESGIQIEDIISVITDISNRTNLLSLNAAIEAAKAGSYGRGFAVVADEVGKLAEKSNDSVIEIRELIERSIRNIQEGTRVIQDARKVLRAIINLVQQISMKINETTAKLIENNSGMNDIAYSAESIVEISERNSTSAQELYGSIKQIANTMETLNLMAEKVNQELTRFQV